MFEAQGKRGWNALLSNLALGRGLYFDVSPPGTVAKRAECQGIGA